MDVICKFDIFNAEYVDKLFKFVIVELPVSAFIKFNNVDDVEFKIFLEITFFSKSLNVFKKS